MGRKYLVAADFGSDMVQRFDDAESEFLALLVFVHDDVLDVAHEAEIVDTMREASTLCLRLPHPIPSEHQARVFSPPLFAHPAFPPSALLPGPQNGQSLNTTNAVREQRINQLTTSFPQTRTPSLRPSPPHPQPQAQNTHPRADSSTHTVPPTPPRRSPPPSSAPAAHPAFRCGSPSAAAGAWCSSGVGRRGPRRGGVRGERGGWICRWWGR